MKLVAASLPNGEDKFPGNLSIQAENQAETLLLREIHETLLSAGKDHRAFMDDPTTRGWNSPEPLGYNQLLIPLTNLKNNEQAN